MQKLICISLILTIIISLASGLTGCAELRDENFIIKEIESIVPNAEFVSMENPDEDTKIYTFTNGTFEFYVEDKVEAISGGFLTNNQYTNYFEKVADAKSGDIRQIVNEYDFKTKLTSDSVECEISKFSQIKEVFEMYENIIKVEEQYLPTQDSAIFSKDIWLHIDATSDVADGIRVAWVSIPLIKSNTYINNSEVAHAELEYVDAVRNFKIVDSTVTKEHFEKYKRIELSELYINGECFESERYEPKFIYNIDDESYYVLVGFGIKEEYNGGIEDYINCEIVRKYHPNSNYTIRSSSGVTTYEIGNASFKVVRDKDTYDLRFYENGKELDIADYEKISSRSSGATYYRFISLDNFAYLIGMEVDMVDSDGGTVYLKTK